MPNNFLDILKGTPIWVFGILAYLLYVGITASRPNVLSIKKLFLLPLIFFILNLRIFFIARDFFVVSLWLMFVFMGISINWLILKKKIIKADKKNQLIALPGEIATLIFLLMFFVIKFYFGFKISQDPNIMKNSSFFYKFVSLSATSFGLFLGKMLCYFNKYKKAESIDLKNV
ncbi:MAG: hypothetical protein K940chlam1_00243 [Candidatus Anoxychlamydiales bacterium]|nr:hypothetical protein [Candidatus Anoxychlamydiales bacterium]NGX35691.1 hypothetical protein [Candidatus Anoxychlamydiales bacterium]